MERGGGVQEQLVSWATAQPEKPCIIEAETEKTLTYKHCLAAVQATRRLLGDEPRCILMALPGGVANAVLWLSALTGGHTLVPVAPDAPAQELNLVAGKFPPDVVIVERPEVAEGLVCQGARFLSHADCLAIIDNASLAEPLLPAVEGWVCLMTSGSTGEPKGVVLGERQVVWTADHIRQSHQLTSEDRGLTVLPFHHINAPVVSLCASLLAGSTVIIAPRFSRTHFWGWVERHHITWASIVPTILALLLRTEKPAFLPGALRFVRTASAPLPALQLRQFEQQFGIPVIETYGLTEAASQVCANLVPPGRHVPGSVGKPVGVSLRICRPRTSEGAQPLQDVSPGETGEVCIAGACVIASYVGDQGKGAFQDGWFRTGDLGYQDAEGYIYLTGRIREVINRGGENIAPREIEEALLAHPNILEVAVVGQPDPLYGEQVVAHLVLGEPWTPALEHSLRTYCAGCLSRSKIPSVFLPIDALPRTHNGKIDRQSLRRKQASHEQREADANVA
ncbi:MAG TPA: AMP-binding protein [Ktedonobacterales bacterium]|jgi:acyl-CoA synthetase (AMP-forming)/AMP-acid ligase II